MRPGMIMAALAASALVATGAHAQESMEAAPACPQDAEAIPPALAGWTTPTPLAAAGDAAGLGAATLTPGTAIDATLGQTGAIRYVVRPERPGGTVSYGGLFAFTVAEAGTYRVALGSGAWIDVLRDRTAIVSTAHGHGPACSGIRKMVDFPLTPGRYVLQIAANGAPALQLMVARLP